MKFYFDLGHNRREDPSIREAVLHDIFLDLQKAYEDIGRDRCLEILAGYGVAPRTLRIHRT